MDVHFVFVIGYFVGRQVIDKAVDPVDRPRFLVFRPRALYGWPRHAPPDIEALQHATDRAHTDLDERAYQKHLGQKFTCPRRAFIPPVLWAIFKCFCEGLKQIVVNLPDAVFTTTVKESGSA